MVEKVKLTNDDLIRLILQINEKYEASTINELLTELENGPEIDLNLVVKRRWER